MKPHVGYTLPILLIVVNMGLSHQKATSNDGTEDYNSYMYNYGDSDPVADPYKDADSIQCYSCYYQFVEGKYVGSANCNSPFNKFGIQMVQCSESCGTAYRKISETDFVISRNCMKECEEYTSEFGNTNCCKDNLCNGAILTTKAAKIILLISCAFSAFMLLQR